MNKIINGKRYDTKTAELIGEASYGYGNDFRKWEEELYRKKTGEFFLWGAGGPLSKYAKSNSGETTNGQEIRPLTLQEAQEWCEEHMDADRYEEIFGEVEEEKTQVSTWLLNSLKTEIDKLREQKGITIAEIIEAGINALSK